ncbi:MAG: hypothetical protein J6B85_09720 [Lachnospiraceae bacterium]|nr:hypothetical protein [Lachnospiraceae bacterium]
MTLADMQKQAIHGWNTWYSESVLTHVLLPYGFAVNLSLRRAGNGAVLRAPLITREPNVRVDVRSWDGSYTCLHINHDNVRMKVESASKDGQQVILVTPEGCYNTMEQLIVEICFLWGREGCLTKENGQLAGICPDGTRIPLYSNSNPIPCFLPEVLLPSQVFTLDTPVVVSTVPCRTLEARAIMDEARAAVLQEASGYGAHIESFQAIQNCLGWNLIYDPVKDRPCAPVSRNWNRGLGGRLFCWDTFFAALLCSLGSKEMAYLNIKAILDEASAEGMIPNASDINGNSNNSQPPVGSMVTEHIWRKYGDDEFLREVYPKLLGWNTWYTNNRMTKEGYLCWGSNGPQNLSNKSAQLHTAKCESGQDNSPMYDDAVYDPETGLCRIADVGLAGLYIKDCRSLIAMAKAAGHPEDIPMLTARMDKAEAALLTLWSEEDGIFENRDLVTGELGKRLSPTNFYSLFSFKVTEEQKRSMLERHLLNPDEFWGDYVLPAISKNDPAFPEQNYWRGRIWAPLNAIVYEALKDAGLTDAAKQLAQKSEQLFLIEWREHRHVHENYCAIDGLGCSVRQSDPFYHWGALLGYLAIDAERL